MCSSVAIIRINLIFILRKNLNNLHTTLKTNAIELIVQLSKSFSKEIGSIIIAICNYIVYTFPGALLFILDLYFFTYIERRGLIITKSPRLDWQKIHTSKLKTNYLQLIGLRFLKK
jgi:hypothetical protein